MEEAGGAAPHAVQTIYYMTPSRPNCLIDAVPAWERKERALAELRSQMTFSGQAFRRLLGKDLGLLVPGHATMDDLSVGTAAHRELDRAVHLYHGLPSHGRFALAEAYRRHGPFHFQTLIP